MSQLGMTRQIIDGVESSRELLTHQCELLAMIYDKLDAGEFSMVVRKTARKKATGSPQVTMKRWLEQCKESGEKPIPADSAVIKFAEKNNIPLEWVHLAFNKFVEKYQGTKKRYASWPLTFKNCVEDNWFKLWWCESPGVYKLTSQGQQEMNKRK